MCILIVYIILYGIIFHEYHYLRISVLTDPKEHNVRVLEPSKPPDRTLFCANIPPWLDVQAIKRIFSASGPIENIYFEFEPSVGAPTTPPASNQFFPSPSDPYTTGRGFKFAYIVYERASGARNALNNLKSDQVHVVSSKERPIQTGLKKWISQYNSQAGIYIYILVISPSPWGGWGNFCPN